MKRRAFLQNASSALGIAALTPAALKSLLSPEVAAFKIGFQTWVVREPLNEDFVGTLKMMRKQGYETLEMCSPIGYQKYGFGPLAEYKPAELKKIMHEEGFTCESSHFTWDELKSDISRSIGFAGDIGLDQMVVSSTRVGEEGTIEDWKKACEQMNKWGMASKKEGFPFAFHNHNIEFEKREGQLIYDVLLENLDPDLVQMQFQVWVVSIGYQAADYFRSHPGRFISAHLADWTGNENERANIGEGKVDWPDFFKAAKKGGLKNIYVEMAPEYLDGSAQYLKTIL